MMFTTNNKIINNKFFELFIPSLLIIAVMNFVGIAGSVVVGLLLGYEYLSVIQVFQPLLISVNILVYLLGIGGQILSSAAKSHFKDYDANQYFTISISTTFILCFVFIIFALLFSDQIISLLTLNTVHAHTSACNLCKSYFNYLIFAIPFSIYLAVLCDFLKVDNYPILATIAVVTANVLNISVAFVLIKYCGMGVEASSLAMLIAELSGGIIASLYFISKKRTLKLVSVFKIKVKTYFTELKNICVTGFPGSSSFIYLTICTFCLNSLAMTSLGYVGLSILNLCSNAMLLGSIIIFASGETASMIQVVLFNEKDYKTVKYVFLLSLKIAVIINLIITLIVLFAPEVIINLFNFHGNNQIITFCCYCLRVFSSYFLPGTLAFLILFYYQVIQKTKISSVMFLIMRVLGPVTIAFLSVVAGYTFGIWFSYAAGSLIVIVLIIILIKFKYHFKDNKKFFNDLLFIEEADEKLMTNITFNKDKTDMVEFKKDIKDYCYEHSINVKGCDDLVEKVISIIFNRNNNSIKNIDLLIRNEESKFEITFKDNGLNQKINEEEFDSILNGVDYEINHINVIGLNLTKFIIKY